ncbi:TPA: YdgH/BhsA/McbA-like domain containing protein [Serratia marcescens]
MLNQKGISWFSAIALMFCSPMVFSAELLTKENFNKSPENYVKIGTIVTSGEMAPSDAIKALSLKADEMGGSHFIITSTTTNNIIHASADVYKEK